MQSSLFFQSNLIGSDLAVQTFRKLPVRTKSRLNIQETQLILRKKSIYYASLTYQQKCQLSLDRLAGIIYRQCRKQGSHLGLHAIRNVLRAEEECYFDLNEIYFE